MKTALFPALALILLGAVQAKPEPAPGRSRVVIVPIVGEIDNGNVALARRASDHVRKVKPDLVLIEIATPGGRMDCMTRIGDELVKMLPVPTAAYVRPAREGGAMSGALSAGVYVAISCKEIWMHPGTVIGAATPIYQTPDGGIQVAPEKINSAGRGIFRARAVQNGYSANLVQAMVDESLEIFEVTVDGKKQYLTEGEMEALRAQGKDFIWPKVPFDSSKKLLTLTDAEVEAAGMGRVANGREVIYKAHGLVSPLEETVELTWSETLVDFLTSGVVSTILLLIGVLGIWVEFKTPGLGAAGVIGVLALALLLFGHHLAGLAEVGEILLVVLGLALIAVEIFLFPGWGVFAIAGVLAILAGLVLSFQDFVIPDTQAAPWQMDMLLSSVGRVVVGIMGATFGFLAVLRFLPKVPFFNRLVLQAEIAGVAPLPEAVVSDLTGKTGHAVTILRPGGKVEIAGQILDVVAEGEFVAQGEPVEVLRVEGMRIVVGKLKR